MKSLGRTPPSGIPELPFRPIDRPELADRLDAAVRGDEHVLLCAAAGTGKTTTVAQWIRGHRPHPDAVIGWLTVTERIDRAERLWAALGDCLGLPDTGAAPRDRFVAPTTQAANLVAALSDSDLATVLVIDDAHLITDPFALAGLEYLLQHVPPAVTVVVCARVDPPLRWHTLELSGRVTRVGSDELALSEPQARELCEQHGCRLDEAELAEVMRLTHGWAALIRITAMHLATHSDDRRAAVTMLARPPRAVSDFLVGELIDTLPAPLRQFLLYTSIPASFTPQLAEALAGPSAAHLLRELERINFPITHRTRDNQLWVSYHPMLRSHFRAEIRYAGTELVEDLNRRTAAWYDEAGLPLWALPHLLGDTDHNRLVEFLRHRGMAIVLDGDGAALFEQLDDARPTLADDPYIWLLRAVDALTHDDITSAATYLDQIGENGSAPTGSVVPTAWLTSITRAARVDAALFDTAATRAPSRITSVGHPDIDCYLATQLGTAQLLHGDRAGGEDQLHRGLALAASANHPHLALRSVTRLAVAAGLEGAVTAMRDRAGKALGVAADHGLHHCADATQATALAAFGAYLQGDAWSAGAPEALAATYEHLDGSVRPAGGWSTQVIGLLLAFHGDSDRYRAADELRHGMLSLLDRGGPFPVASGRLLPHTVWALLAVREPRTALLLIERARAVLGTTPEVLLSQAALALTTDKPQTLDTALDPLRAHPETLATAERVTMRLLCAARHTLDNASHKARDELAEAVALAAPDRLIRPFLDVPGAITMLDGQVGTFGPHDDFVQRVRHHPDARRATAEQSLTTAELTVLKQLPSGHTAQEIAADLGVSINTVKTHLRGIYTKLGANSRNTALDRARHIGLL